MAVERSQKFRPVGVLSTSLWSIEPIRAGGTFARAAAYSTHNSSVNPWTISEKFSDTSWPPWLTERRKHFGARLKAMRNFVPLRACERHTSCYAT